jgi:hypothetical protein
MSQYYSFGEAVGVPSQVSATPMTLSVVSADAAAEAARLAQQREAAVRTLLQHGASMPQSSGGMDMKKVLPIAAAALAALFLVG